MVLLGVVFIEIELNTIAGGIAEEQLYLSGLGDDGDLVADTHLGEAVLVLLASSAGKGGVIERTCPSHSKSFVCTRFCEMEDRAVTRVEPMTEAAEWRTRPSTKPTTSQ